MKMSFTGAAELQTAFAALKDNATRRRVADRALRKAAEPIRDAAIALAPEETGDLKKAIKIGKAIKAYQRSANRGQEVTTFIGIDESVNRRLHIYAEIDEFGKEGTPAQPYMRPAWEANRQAALDTIAAITGEEITKTAARAARKAAK